MRGPIKAQSLQVLNDRGVIFKTILDVGVLTGTPELVRAFPNQFHVLFEPVAEFAGPIEAAYANVPHKLVHAAVSNSVGQTVLSISSVVAGFDITHSTMVDAAPEPSSRTVPMVTIDSYLAENAHDGPYLLKIDIDGYELRVIEGAKHTLANTPIVIVETPILEFTPRIAALEQAGYVLFDLIEPCYYDDALWQCDAVMIRREVRAERFGDIHQNFNPNLYRPFTG